MTIPAVSVIILNYNNNEDTFACLKSLELIKSHLARIILVDNASTDQSLSRIREWLKSYALKDIVCLMDLKENFGFAGGNNKALSFALTQEARYILLLNNDTLIKNDFLADLLKQMESDKTIGVLGCKIYHYPEENKVWFNGGRIDYVRGFGTHYRDDFEGLRECDFVTGCLMLIPTKVLKEVGLFDEKYFLISEDADLCQRIKKSGYKISVDGRTYIYHKISATMGGFYSPVTQYYFHRNRMVFMISVLKFQERIIFLLFQFGIVIPVWSLLEICKGKGPYVLWAWRGYKDFIFNRLGKRDF